ncbi:MAG: hypothetical protein M1820_008322 [Bogoriella megaspora]|nr:MAG: hypothetical protein M1820_008322 [Bogoriella megaspora]
MANTQSLANRISTSLSALTKLTEATYGPSLDLSESGALVVGEKQGSFAAQDESLSKARNDLVNTAQELLHLAQGPIDHMVSLAYGATDTANLAMVVQFGIPQKVPFHMSISLSDLAIATSLPEDTLARTMRYAITNGVFAEPSPGRFAHTAASATLAKNKNLSDMVIFKSGFSSRVVISLADALKAQQLNALDAPEAAFNVSYPGYANFFEYMGKHPEASQGYFDYLDGRSKLPLYAVENVVGSWDWAKVGSGLIVDVGGSSGHTSIALARAFPSAKFLVQDINLSGLELGREIVGKDPDLKQRVSFQEHDFFKPQLVEADVYFFRNILHDWPDEKFIEIIQALVPALKSGSRILLSEGVMPEPPAARSALLEDKQVRMEDLAMVASHNSRERSVDQYTSLFKAVDGRFSLVGVTGKRPGVHHSLIEYTFAN